MLAVQTHGGTRIRNPTTCQQQTGILFRSSAALPRTGCFCAVGNQPVCSKKWRSSFTGSALIFQKRAKRLVDKEFQTVKAAIFGVGAPEALLVGVVALVVFGPKGLAQAVKSLGATLRTFSPTIKELASVTNELSSTLQEQIGLDDIRNEFRNSTTPYRPELREIPNSSTASTSASTSDSKGKEDTKELSKESDEDLAAKIEESKRMAWGGSDSSDSTKSKAESKPAGSQSTVAKAGQEGSGTSVKSGQEGSGKSAADFSVEELEAELRRRKQTSKS